MAIVEKGERQGVLATEPVVGRVKPCPSRRVRQVDEIDITAHAAIGKPRPGLRHGQDIPVQPVDPRQIDGGLDRREIGVENRKGKLSPAWTGQFHLKIVCVVESRETKGTHRAPADFSELSRLPIDDSCILHIAEELLIVGEEFEVPRPPVITG
ncbi:hypothetical protein [Rhizobium sp. 007]|uniref:hypothetical protein n=1 Tax=Rhizobium sp. 007 TaxID=2785056 RepID=UPI001FED9F7D|nr:hypothetical protein [Rhizobium sp. 007]